MNRRLLIGAALLLVAAVGLLAVLTGGKLRANANAALTPTPAPAENVIWASGKLVPGQWAGLSPSLGGTVHAIHAREGETVPAGTLLVELAAPALQRQVDVAAAAVREAEAARAKLLAGATAEQVAQAEAEVQAAQAGVAIAEAGVQSAERAAAAAESQVAIARAQYAELASRPSAAEKVAAQREISLAQATVKQAQAAYDQVRGDPQIATRPEALLLEQATLRFNSTKAAYDVTTQGATPEQLAVARAQVAAAESQAPVAAAQVPAGRAQVQAAQAQLARAQATLQALKAGPSAEDRAVAEMRLGSAQAAQAAAEAQLAQMQVSAPFAGQIGTINARLGEMAVPGQPLLLLGDTSRLQVETTDLRETDVTRLKLSMPVEVTFDALPNRRFQGTVNRIAPMSTMEKGSTNYTVIVAVNDLDPALRWGMTAFVNLQGQPLP